jgi:broad-specificity NMP kinase
MIRELLYVCGAPGVGKSTLMRELRAPWDCEVMGREVVPHVRLRNVASGSIHGLELGVPRPQFPGTDALSMSISPHALSFLSSVYHPFVMAEGARLATRPFLGTLAQQGVRVTLVQLTAHPSLLDERWRLRGAKQSVSWRKGAATRAARITQWFASNLGTGGFRQLVSIDVTDEEPREIAAKVREAFPLVDEVSAGAPARRAVGD